MSTVQQLCAEAHRRQREEREAAALEARTALRAALAQVYDGAELIEADCVIDHLSDLGWRLEREATR